jgi:hypothetical protein
VEGGEKGQGEEDGIESALGDALDEPASREEAEGDRREEDGVEGKCIEMNEVEGYTEGDFEAVDDEKKAGAGASELEFGNGDGKEVESGDGASGVGEHGGDSREEADASGEPCGVGEVFEEGGLEEAEELEGGEGEDDGSDEGLVVGVADLIDQPSTDDHADGGGGEESSDEIPAGVLAESINGEEICADEHGEDHASGWASAEEVGEDEDVEEADPGEATFGESDAEGCDDGEGPLEWGEVKHAARGVIEDGKGKIGGKIRGEE